MLLLCMEVDEPVKERVVGEAFVASLPSTSQESSSVSGLRGPPRAPPTTTTCTACARLQTTPRSSWSGHEHVQMPISTMAVNDLAIAMPPGRAPVLVAVFMSEGRDEEDGAINEAGFAEVGRLVTREMGRG